MNKEKFYKETSLLRLALISPALLFFLLLSFLFIIPLRWIGERLESMGDGVEEFFIPIAQTIYQWTKRK